MSEINNGSRMLRNTMFLYIRMFVIMCINLIAVRLLLQTLGETDYGIYNVVGGVVAMLTFLSSTMSSAALRFYSYYMGKNDAEQLNKVFRVSILTFIVIVLVAVMLAETAGLWLVNTQLTIPENRLYASNWVYQLSIITFSINMLVVPFMALIIATERMDFYAIVSMIDAFLKLGIIFVIKESSVDKLILYSSLYTIISLANIIAYGSFIKLKHRKLLITPLWDRGCFIQLFSYCGWYMFGSVSTVLRSQGINILLNIFFNPAINAARGLAYQVNSAVNMFVTSFYQSVRPQITKRYAADEMDSMRSLVLKSTKLSYYLVLLIAVPLLIWMPNILSLWLDTVPDYTVLFTRLVIVATMIDTIGHPLTTAVCADGNIKWFQIITGCIVLMNLPISYLFLKLGYPPQITIYIAIVVAVIVQIIKMYFSRKVYHLDLIVYIGLMGKLLIITIISLIIPFLISRIWFVDNLFSLSVVLILVLIYISIIIYLIGLDNSDREMLKRILTRKNY